MFEHQTHRSFARHRHRDNRNQAGRELRESLRRNLRHGAGAHSGSLRDLFGGRGGAIRRGEIRPLIVAALRQKPMHGYEVIQELEAQSGGRWRPSAGSVYPTLQQLADEGLVTSEEVDGRRTYTLTEEGRRAAAETGSRSPWAEQEDDGAPDLRQLAMQLAAAVVQVHKLGSPQAQRDANRILVDARKQMYRLLAEDDIDSPEPENSEASKA